MLTMIYDNKNFIVVLALHASRTRLHCNSQTAYFLAVNLLYFQMKNPLLAIDTKFTIYKLYKLHSNRSRFSDDFPTISFATPIFSVVPFATIPRPHTNCAFFFSSSFSHVSFTLAFTLYIAHFRLFHTLVLYAIIVVVIVDVVYLIRLVHSLSLTHSLNVSRDGRNVHFLETNFGVSVLKLFPYVMIWRQFLHFLVGFCDIRFTCIVNCLHIRSKHTYIYILSAHRRSTATTIEKAKSKCLNRTNTYGMSRGRQAFYVPFFSRCCCYYCCMFIRFSFYSQMCRAYNIST